MAMPTPAYRPLPHQASFHRSPARYRALVGGVGSGKTVAGAREALKQAQLHPGSLGLIGRLTATALRDTTMRAVLDMIPPEIIHDWRQTDGHLWLRTKVPGVYSEILFRHLDEAGPLGSLDLDWWWIDEAHEPDGQEIPEETFLMLMARLRGRTGPHRGWVTSNPGGHDWVWRWFVAEQRPGFDCVVARTFDNPYLPDHYRDIAELHRLPDGSYDEWGRRYLEASFDVFEGQIYPEFSEHRHVVSEVPENRDADGRPLWPLIGALDFGVRNPTVVLTAFVDYDSVLWVIDEFYRSEASVEDVAAWIKAHGLRWVTADPSTANRGPGGVSAAHLYAEHGVTLAPGQNDVRAGIEAVRRLLREDRLRIHRRCRNLIEEMRQYRWAPGRMGEREQPWKEHDHAVDALRYLVMSLPQAPERPRPVIAHAWAGLSDGPLLDLSADLRRDQDVLRDYLEGW